MSAAIAAGAERDPRSDLLPRTVDRRRGAAHRRPGEHGEDPGVLCAQTSRRTDGRARHRAGVALGAGGERGAGFCRCWAGRFRTCRLAAIGNDDQAIEIDLAQSVAATAAAMASTSTLERF